MPQEVMAKLRATVQVERGTVAKVSVAVGVFFALLLLPLPGSLPPEGRRVLAIMGLAVMLWVTDLLAPALTGLLAVVLLVILKGVPDLRSALTGFASPVAYFVIGILGLGMGMSRSGLAERVASRLTAWARGNPRLLYWQMLLSYVPMTFMLPSATTRNGIQIPVYNRVLERWGVPSDSLLARAVTLALGSLNRLSSTALLTGGTAPVAAAGLIGGMSWSRWFLLLGVPYYVLLFAGGFIVYVWYRKGFSVTPRETSAAAKRPWTGVEARALAIALLTSALWATDFLHHLPPEVPALLALVLLLMPKIGVLQWAEFERNMSWATFVVLATSLSLAGAMTGSGVAQWLAEGIRGAVRPLMGSPLALIMGLMAVCAGVRLFIPSIVGYLSLTMPVAMSLGQAIGLNPVVCGLVALIAGDAAQFYAAAGGSGVIAYGNSDVSGGEIFRLAVVMALLAFVMVAVVALPWWALMGEPLVR